MAVIRVQPAGITVKLYFPQILPLEGIIIENGDGSFTVFRELGNAHCILQVDNGSQVNPRLVSEIVVASGRDAEGRFVVPSGRLETLSAGTRGVPRAIQLTMRVIASACLAEGGRYGR